MKKRTPRMWARLDNAAKIFPPNSEGRNTHVFRFACELTEPVDPDMLQTALERTLSRFPLFRSILRRGLFWPYLEQSNLEARIHKDDRPLCQRLYDPNVKELLFDVSYYNCRINFEVYHVLTDGTGALQFLQQLVYHYLVAAQQLDADAIGPLPYDASEGEKGEDSFARHYRPGRTASSRRITAFQEKFSLLPESRLEVIEGQASVAQALARAKAHGVSMTIYLCAVMLCAYGEIMSYKDRKQPVVLSVPVNLRQFFDSETARNFFSLIFIRYTFAGDDIDFEDVLASVKAQFHEELTREKLSQRMTTLVRFEHNPFIRVVPLFIKNFFLRIASQYTSRESTLALSNVGRIDMPPALAPYISGFDVFISTDRMQLCLCSFQDRLALSISTAFASTEVPMRFFRRLAADGLDIVISTSMRDEDAPADA